jgi:hypothetical protein
MEFSTPNKAKKITLSLIIFGAALAAIGIVTGLDDHHFATRLLTNGLINAFFFFAIALGALFFPHFTVCYRNRVVCFSKKSN